MREDTKLFIVGAIMFAAGWYIHALGVFLK